MSEKIAGLLGCTSCSRKRGIWINLGKDGLDREVILPGVRCEAVERLPNGLIKLLCGAFSGGFPTIKPEWLEIEGKRYEGVEIAKISAHPRVIRGGGL
jgi:hypothetical protein